MSICDTTLESVTSVRDACPAHYSFKIESFSGLLKMLSKTGKENYETCEFEIGGYNWKLSLYPKGDKKRNTTDNMSLYLVFSDTNTQQPSRTEATAFFRLFLYDQIKDKYYMVQDVSEKVVRFHTMKTESGFSHFIPLSTFYDTSKGYIVDDCCVFGAEVFVTNSSGKGESVSISKEPQKTAFSWKINNYSKLVPEDEYSSEDFIVEGHRWQLTIYPVGRNATDNMCLELYLASSSLCPGQNLYCESTLRLKDQLKGKHHECKVRARYTSNDMIWGRHRFILLSVLQDKSNGFLVDDTLIFEAQISLLSLVTTR